VSPSPFGEVREAELEQAGRGGRLHPRRPKLLVRLSSRLDKVQTLNWVLYTTAYEIRPAPSDPLLDYGENGN
jgi:hypothetical protein